VVHRVLVVVVNSSLSSVVWYKILGQTFVYLVRPRVGGVRRDHWDTGLLVAIGA